MAIPVFDAPGQVTFDGTNGDVIELPHDASLELGAGTVAFSFVTADTDGAQGLFSKDFSGFGGGKVLKTDTR